MNPQTLNALDNGGWVVTATRRLSYELKRAYDSLQSERGKQVWPTAHIFTWEGWMQSLWEVGSTYTDRASLSDPQLHQLMSEIIEQDLKKHNIDDTPNFAELWNVKSTANIALEAWQLCHQWHISYTSFASSGHRDHAGFSRWAKTLHARLYERNWISTAQIPDQLIEAGVYGEQSIILCGFDSLNPQQQRFIENYQVQGGNVSSNAIDRSPSKKLPHCSFDSQPDEWRQIGAWARAKLMEMPQARIGIITPDIENIRPLAQQALREQLCPDWFKQSHSDPFHFSMGESLAQLPLVDSALSCLELLTDIEFTQLNSIFLSSHWGNQNEHLRRATYLIDLRRQLPYHFDLYELNIALAKLCEADEQESDDSLRRRLASMQAIKANNRGVFPLSRWREVFTQCLDAITWPISGLDSEEYQILQAWEVCLQNWASLDLVSHPVSLIAALQSLGDYCSKTTFQARITHQAPVQIMGVLEAAELPFDAVWLASFDERIWPRLVPTNPFIPISAQLKAGIPEASSSRQNDLASRKTRQLCTLCDDVTISHTRIQEDIELEISPLFTELTYPFSYTQVSTFSLDEAIRSNTPALNSLVNDSGPEYQQERARGGASLVQKQAACPFSAYAAFRLNLWEEAEPEIGNSALERGTLLHNTLEAIWYELGNSQALAKHIADDSLEQLVSRHCDIQLQRQHRKSGLGDGFVSAEQQRLERLLHEWLSLEARRPAFSVNSLEQTMEYTLHGLTFRLKLDRTDQIGSSSQPAQAIIDYKTGKCDLKSWTSTRPDQPQIPLYYLAYESLAPVNQVDTLCFAQVKSEQCAFIGVSRQPDTLPDVSTVEALRAQTSLKKEMSTWPDLKQRWSSLLGQIVDEFVHGYARVSPKSPASCEYCNFGPLCRIHTHHAFEQEAELD